MIIPLDFEWGAKKELDSLETIVLSCIVGGIGKYEDLCTLFQKIGESVLSDTLDSLAERDWIMLDKSNQDIYVLSERGRYHYADHPQRPKRTTNKREVTNNTSIPVLAGVGEMVFFDKRRWMVTEAKTVRKKVLFNLESYDSNKDVLKDVEGTSTLSVEWYTEIKAFFKLAIEKHGYPKYAHTWAQVMAYEWVKYYKLNDWRVGKAKTKMISWKGSINTWVEKEYSKTNGCKFGLPHPNDPLHPNNVKAQAYSASVEASTLAASLKD